MEFIQLDDDSRLPRDMRSQTVGSFTLIMNFDTKCCLSLLFLSLCCVRGQVTQENEVNRTQVNSSDHVDANIYVSNPYLVSFQEVNAPFSPFPRWFDVTLQSIWSSMKADDSKILSEPGRPNVLKKFVQMIKQGVKSISKAIKDLFKSDDDAKYNPHPPPPPANARRV